MSIEIKTVGELMDKLKNNESNTKIITKEGTGIAFVEEDDGVHINVIVSN